MKAKFYIQTKDGDRTFYERKPENLHVTDALTGHYTGYPAGACWVWQDLQLYKLFRVSADTQVITNQNYI